MPTAIDRTKINGVSVVARQPATQSTPLSKNPVPLTGVDEVLLDDGTTVHQCVAVDTCGYTNASKLSVRAHLTKHSAKRAIARQQAGNAKKGNGTKAAATRNARREAVNGENGTAFLAGLADQLEAAVPLLREMAKDRVEPRVDEAELAELAELRDKAMKLDQLKGFSASDLHRRPQLPGGDRGRQEPGNTSRLLALRRLRLRAHTRAGSASRRRVPAVPLASADVRHPDRPAPSVWRGGRVRRLPTPRRVGCKP